MYPASKNLLINLFLSFNSSLNLCYYFVNNSINSSFNSIFTSNSVLYINNLYFFFINNFIKLKYFFNNIFNISALFYK